MREKFVISIEVEAYHVEKLALLNSCFFVLKVDSLITNSIRKRLVNRFWIYYLYLEMF